MSWRQLSIHRRSLFLWSAAAATGQLLSPARSSAGSRTHDIGGSLPPLAFTMTSADDGRTVTAADFRGRAVMLYFGYTSCPDVCPTTLANLASVLDQLGPDAGRVLILFVTVDPARDTLAVLKPYAALFSPRVTALRGTPDQLAALARRCRVVYSAGRRTPDQPYQVTHSAAVYVFDATGATRLLLSGMDSGSPDIAAMAAALRAVVERPPAPGRLGRLLRML